MRLMTGRNRVQQSIDADRATRGLRGPAVSLDRLQDRIGAYVDATWPDETVMHAGLGLAEEAGELARALLKREHGTRGSHAEWTAEVRKEAADVAVVLLDIARREGFSLADAITERWAVVESRDPNHDPIGS